MNRRLFALFAVFLLHQPASAQRMPVDPPLLGRPDDFSNIVGRYQTPQVEAFPTEVHVEEPITLRITITGVGPVKYEPKREHLKLFSAAGDKHFYVEELHNLDSVDRAAKSWLFVYRLRPKHTKIDTIADIRLVYYNSEVGKFETRFADSIPIVVKPRREHALDTEVATQLAPDSFYQTAPINLDRSSYSFGLPHLVGVVTVSPLACLLGAWAWRRYRPDERERRRRLRSQAAAQALAQLQTPAAPVWDIVGRYLRERFDVAFEEPTPAEVLAALLRRGFGKDLCGRCGALMQACDAQRFGGGVQTTLADDAARLIAALEADPCAR